MDKWQRIAEEFSNIGLELGGECNLLHEMSVVSVYFEHLYSNYVQLMDSIKAQRQVISDEFADTRDRVGAVAVDVA